MFQIAIVTFVIGSLLCGISQNMTQLVLARGLQGVGGGGLFAMAFTIIGDVVPPRDRGRYVGFITSVFAFSSVAGPLIGGFIVDHFSWRWIFTINVPLGIIAMVVTTSALRLPFVRQKRSVDYVGATLLVGSVTTLILMATWAGEGRYSWGSAVTIGLGAASLVLAAVFVLWELRNPEPIVPMRLFRNPIVAVIVPMMVCLGTIMFGATAFLPLYLQAVDGVSATESGLLLLPLMLGVTISSITSGRITSRTGRYKAWPIAGSSLAAIGVLLLAFLDGDTTRLYISVAMLSIGLGFGMVMPTSTLAVQNSVEWHDLGVATSLVTFFRSLGGAVGLAVCGAIFNARMRNSGVPEQLLRSPSAINDLPPGQREPVIDALADAIGFIFVVVTPVMVVCVVLSLFVKEIPLRASSAMQQGQADQAAASAAH
jgi:EmrB/QacA subfamily drug resistance transporter